MSVFVYETETCKKLRICWKSRGLNQFWNAGSGGKSCRSAQNCEKVQIRISWTCDADLEIRSFLPSYSKGRLWSNASRHAKIRRINVDSRKCADWKLQMQMYCWKQMLRIPRTDILQSIVNYNHILTVLWLHITKLRWACIVWANPEYLDTIVNDYSGGKLFYDHYQNVAHDYWTSKSHTMKIHRSCYFTCIFLTSTYQSNKAISVAPSPLHDFRKYRT